jgi:hypothetical protein
MAHVTPKGFEHLSRLSNLDQRLPCMRPDRGTIASRWLFTPHALTPVSAPESHGGYCGIKGANRVAAVAPQLHHLE